METHNLSLFHKIMVHLKTSNQHLLLSIRLCTFTPTHVSCQLLNSPCTAVLITAAVLGRTAPSNLGDTCHQRHHGLNCQWWGYPGDRNVLEDHITPSSPLSLSDKGQTKQEKFDSTLSGRAESCTSFQITPLRVQGGQTHLQIHWQ